MSLSATATGKLESLERSARLVSARELRLMLKALGVYQFSSRRATALTKLCAVGVEYGWGELERIAGRNLLCETTAGARASLRRHLQKTLERITRPCLELEWTSFKLALASLGIPSSDSALTERMFLRERPGDRLSLLFQKFPVLAQLWCLTVGQWRGHVLEVLDRVRKDGPALSRFLFCKSSTGAIMNLQLGLSDRHNGGRSVTLIEFSGGRRVIYKPRPGSSESAWFSFLAWMNDHGFHPKLRLAGLLIRKSYYWMEYVEAASCDSKAAARRFYERLGGLIAAAYLLKAVDCHRENVIAAGEDPALVDIDALWHVSPLTRTQNRTDVLHRTGFFPNSNPVSLQSRSSVLGPGTTGNHLARIAGKPVLGANHTREIIKGFSRAWNCTLQSPARRSAFLLIVRGIRSQPRRWIYRATETYSAIIRASIQPSALGSEAARRALIAGLCSRRSARSEVMQAEIRALERLDIPYFIRTTNQPMPVEKGALPAELVRAVQKALDPRSL